MHWLNHVLHRHVLLLLLLLLLSHLLYCRELVGAGLRALVYSGTADYVVPFTGSRAWVYGLGLPTAKPWRAWSIPGSKQVGFRGF
jgi:hypothetical protein